MFLKKFVFRKTNGFTLIEMLVYVATLAILTGALINFFIWSIDVNAKIKTKQTTLKEAQKAIEKILFEIREAQSIYTPTSVFGQHPGQLSLKTTHNPPTGETSTFIDFYLCGEQICFKKEGYEATPLTSDKTIVEQLFFTRLSASSTESIQIGLSLKYNTPNNKPAWQASTSLTSTATIRNHE